MRPPSACMSVTYVELFEETFSLAGSCNGMSNIGENKPSAHVHLMVGLITCV